MSITFSCPCGEPLEVDADLAGRQVRCPYCRAVLDVPAAPPSPPPAKRARLAEPEETDDDHGAYAGSLNPLDRRNRRPSRRRDDEGDDDRPSRRRPADDEGDRPRRRRDEPPPYKLMNKQVVGGAVCVLIGVVATGLLVYFLDRVGCWFVILIVAGCISLVRGLITGRDS